MLDYIRFTIVVICKCSLYVGAMALYMALLMFLSEVYGDGAALVGMFVPIFFIITWGMWRTEKENG